MIPAYDDNKSKLDALSSGLEEAHLQSASDESQDATHKANLIQAKLLLELEFARQRTREAQEERSHRWIVRMLGILFLLILFGGAIYALYRIQAIHDIQKKPLPNATSQNFNE